MKMINFLDKSNTNIERIAKYARFNLQSPEIIFMQEVTDDSGLVDDGVVSSYLSLKYLCEVLNNSYFNSFPYPTRNYKYVYIVPENNKSGGVLGSNIRVVVLYDALSISIQEYYNIGLSTSTPPEKSNIFSRHPLYVKIKHNLTEEIYHLIAVHLVSAIRDSDIWGSVQPPIKFSEPLRIQQTTYIKNWITYNLNKNVDNIVVAGDFNDPEWSNSIKVLDDNTPNRFMKNLVNDVKESERYSIFTYRGQSLCDHVIVSEPLYHKITNVFQTDVNIPNKPYIKFSDILTSQFWIEKIGEPILFDHNTLCARIPL
jgi:predicted extracellular nuclease